MNRRISKKVNYLLNIRLILKLVTHTHTNSHTHTYTISAPHPCIRSLTTGWSFFMSVKCFFLEKKGWILGGEMGCKLIIIYGCCKECKVVDSIHTHTTHIRIYIKKRTRTHSLSLFLFHTHTRKVHIQEYTYIYVHYLCLRVSHHYRNAGRKNPGSHPVSDWKKSSSQMLGYSLHR